MTALLEVRDVTKVFGGGVFERTTTVALENVSFSISAEHPAITAIAGESGSGKTTLARMLLGVITPTSGSVLYKGQDIHARKSVFPGGGLLGRLTWKMAMSSRELRNFRREVQPIFQDPFEVYNPFYNVDHVLTTPIKKFRMAGSKDEARQMMIDALEQVGLRPDETLGRFPHQLSGGQRQRVMVARALLLKPGVILADEPVSMVDASLRATILDSIKTLNREFGISIVYITHDLTTAYQIADNIVVLYRGSVVEAGRVSLVIKDPKHPYTQLLVESIPQPDPEKKWGEEGSVQSSLGIAAGTRACKFVDRCPVAMPMCAESVPPLYQLDPTRVAACFVYRDSPVLASEEVSEMVAAPPSARAAVAD